MSLPTPRLDDRTFQQLVDEAKLRIQRTCPTWSNHNVSDPGITLVETFAWMTEMLLYRVNRVPDTLHVRFLELLGVRLFPPRAARTDVTFRLSSHQDEAILIPAGTAVSTRRTTTQEALVFSTVEDLRITPATSVLVGTMGAQQQLVDRTAQMGLGNGFEAFAEPPKVGDAVYVQLDQPAPSAILLLQLVCSTGGHGIDPRDPPLVWEASTLGGWVRCEVEQDTTGGLNISGAVELHLPADHAELGVSGTTGAWVRCRVIENARTLPYRSSPELLSVTAATVGGDVVAVHAEAIERELLGTSDGTAGQRFFAHHTPVLPDADVPLIMEVGSPDLPTPQGTGRGRWTTWQARDDFSDSADDAQHFTVDRSTGEIRFGPQIRLDDGSLRRYGAVPPRGSQVRLLRYGTGGGRSGNVAARTLSVLRSSIQCVASVYNRHAALGGVDGETVAEAMTRGPLEVQRRRRAVTADDYVAITREAAPELARVHCLPVEDGVGALRVLVVPQAAQVDGRIALADLRLPQGAREKVERALDTARVIGARVSVEPPSYVGVRIDAQVRAHADADVEKVEREATAALYRYFNPLSGGPSGNGWPLGRPVQNGEVYSVLSRVPGVDYVDRVVLFRADPRNGSVGEPTDRIDLAATHLVISVEHLIAVEAALS
jgi:predicted phage baseplate assembly protein